MLLSNLPDCAKTTRPKMTNIHVILKNMLISYFQDPNSFRFNLIDSYLTPSNIRALKTLKAIPCESRNRQRETGSVTERVHFVTEEATPPFCREPTTCTRSPSSLISPFFEFFFTSQGTRLVWSGPIT